MVNRFRDFYLLPFGIFSGMFGIDAIRRINKWWRMMPVLETNVSSSLQWAQVLGWLLVLCNEETRFNRDHTQTWVLRVELVNSNRKDLYEVGCRETEMIIVGSHGWWWQICRPALGMARRSPRQAIFSLNFFAILPMAKILGQEGTFSAGCWYSKKCVANRLGSCKCSLRIFSALGKCGCLRFELSAIAKLPGIHSELLPYLGGTVP